MSATSLRERVVRFGPADGLAGILTTNRDAQGELPHVVIVNAGIIHRVGPNRLYVDLARTMAMHGYPVLRFDLAGLGDSDVMTGGASLAESALQDVSAAFDHLGATRGATSFVIVGLCSGANYAVMTAFSEPRVIGALLVDPTVARTGRSAMIHIGRRLRNLSTLRSLLTLRHPVFRRSLGGMRSVAVAQAAAGQSGQRAERDVQPATSNSTIRAAMQQLIDRGVHLMMVFTGGVNHVYNYEGQLYDLLPGLSFRNQLKLLYMPETDHTVSDVTGRQKLLTETGKWLQSVFPSGSAVTSDAPAGAAKV